MLRVLLFNLERKDFNEQFGFNVHLAKDNSNVSSAEINEIKTGSNAEIVGLQIGDRVLAVDGQNLSTAKDVYESFQGKLQAKIMIERMTGVAQKPPVKNKTFDIRSSRTNNDDHFHMAVRQISAENNGRRNSHPSSEPQIPVPVAVRPTAIRQNYSSSGRTLNDRSIAFNNGYNHKKSDTRNLPRLQMPIPTSLPDVSDVTVRKSKKTLADFLGQPGDVVSFDHHTKKNDDDDDDEGPSYSYRSILDVCPEGSMLLSLAGRPSYSADLRD